MQHILEVTAHVQSEEALMFHVLAAAQLFFTLVLQEGILYNPVLVGYWIKEYANINKTSKRPGYYGLLNQVTRYFFSKNAVTEVKLKSERTGDEARQNRKEG